jgi:NAD(P)-dependent dehydrogenase (short-subunit alcohol dehydrogenase family)
MKGRLSGRTAIITGGGRGIGEAIATLFAAEGANLAVASRSLDELEAVADRCRSQGARCIAHKTDVARQEDVRSLVQATVSEFGGVDILVTAAGVYGPIGLVADVSLDDWEAALRVNLLGTLYACQQVLPHMTSRRRGSIVNFSGGGATSPLPRFSAYGVSKAAVVRLTETLAAECREQGVRVNAIAPGAVDTRLQDEVLRAGSQAGDLHARILALRTSGAGGTPVEVPAGLALFLASDDSKDLTGRLVSAPHDPWQEWTPERIAALGGTDWLTLRRIDPFTIQPLVNSQP